MFTSQIFQQLIVSFSTVKLLQETQILSTGIAYEAV